jgi:hypothetical protein
MGPDAPPDSLPEETMTHRSTAAIVLTLAALAAFAAVALAAGPSITVYTRDLGLVREQRTLALTSARDTVRLTDVPESIDFASVRLVPEGGSRVTRLAYRFDVINGDALIDHARGRRVRVSGRDNRVTEGALLSADGSWLVVRADDGALSTLARGQVDEVRLAEPPSGLSLRPTLEAVLEGGRAGRVDAELSYLTGGLSWDAEHTVVRRGENAARWGTSVTVINTTGRTWENAELKLVAGDPRRTTPRPMPMTMMRAQAEGMQKMADGADLSEEAFSEYHLYSLGRPATLRDRETQSLTMLDPRDIKVTPRYVYRGGDPRGVASVLEIVNAKDAGLGVPLPGGRVRFYEADASGALQFTGETRIGHTAVDEKMTLEVGTAFDLAAERKEAYNNRISDHEREYQVVIELRNRKANDVVIRVEENVGGDIEVTKKTHDFTRKDANTLVFNVPVPKGQKVTLSYTARVRF